MVLSFWWPSYLSLLCTPVSKLTGSAPSQKRMELFLWCIAALSNRGELTTSAGKCTHQKSDIGALAMWLATEMRMSVLRVFVSHFVCFYFDTESLYGVLAVLHQAHKRSACFCFLGTGTKKVCTTMPSSYLPFCYECLCIHTHTLGRSFLVALSCTGTHWWTPKSC